MIKPVDPKELDLVRLLVDRLEHLSADSLYAHRASGLRGSLLGYVEHLEAERSYGDDDKARLEQLMEFGFEILELAAKEVG